MMRARAAFLDRSHFSAIAFSFSINGSGMVVVRTLAFPSGFRLASQHLRACHHALISSSWSCNFRFVIRRCIGEQICGPGRRIFKGYNVVSVPLHRCSRHPNPAGFASGFQGVETHRVAPFSSPAASPGHNPATMPNNTLRTFTEFELPLTYSAHTPATCCR